MASWRDRGLWPWHHDSAEEITKEVPPKTLSPTLHLNPDETHGNERVHEGHTPGLGVVTAQCNCHMEPGTSVASCASSDSAFARSSGGSCRSTGKGRGRLRPWANAIALCIVSGWCRVCVGQAATSDCTVKGTAWPLAPFQNTPLA